MKNLLSSIFPLILFFIGTMAGPRSACTMDDCIASSPSGEANNGSSSTDTAGSRLRIKVGSTAFTATLLNNATVTAFKARLPMTLSMKELNGNEKYYNLPKDLPASASNPGTIQTGDLALYGSNTLVLFYKSFSTSYRYTKMGCIDNPAGLAAALGSGNVPVIFELE